ncbi:DNA-binding protein, partial [Escherichia coli]|nr:DNA-binding protein [Escherichia coli]
GEIETALSVFETRPVRFEADDIARAGVFISIAHDGSIAIDRGYVRAEDEVPEPDIGADGGETEGRASEPGAPAVQRAVITIGGQPVEA